MTTLNETMSENEIKNGSAVLHRYENISTNYIMCIIRKLTCTSHNGPIGEEVEYCNDHNDGSGCKDRVGKDSAIRKRKVNIICAECEIARLRAELDEARSSTRTSASSTRTSSSSGSSKKSNRSFNTSGGWSGHKTLNKDKARHLGVTSSQYKVASFMGLIR
jgi:hypothetical protein